MSPLGLHPVLGPSGVPPRAAWRLDARSEIWPDEVRVAVDRRNLGTASFRPPREASGGDPAAARAAAAVAAALGVDKIFGKGTTLSEVASYLGDAGAGTTA